MSKNTFIIILGLFVALNPYLGFSQKTKTFIFVFLGLLIALVGYLIARQNRSRPRSNDVFEENGGFSNDTLNSGQISLLKDSDATSQPDI